MTKAEITNSFISVFIEPVLTLSPDLQKGLIRFNIKTEDNVNSSDLAQHFNNIEIDIFGEEALVQLTDALNIYIDKMELRCKISPSGD